MQNNEDMITKSTWVETDISRLKRIYNQCKNLDESTLMSNVLAVLHLLDGMSHMGYTQFHFYEKEMFWDAMEIFTEHFIEQINLILSEEFSIVKKQLLDDMEDALTRMYQVYRDIVDSKASLDWQPFHSVIIDTSICNRSPKWTIFYNGILKQLASTFSLSKEKKEHYQFILYPSLQNNAFSYKLFDKREKSGKVVIIYVPERMIEELDIMAICLTHEAFHVLTRDQKMLKNRAVFLLKSTLLCIRHKLFDKVCFDEDRKIDLKIKEELTEIWFRKIKQLAQKIEDTKPQNDRWLYSNKLIQEIDNEINRCFCNLDIDLSKTVMSVCMKVKAKDYEQYYDGFQDARKNINTIRENYNHILRNNTVKSIAHRLVSIYKEIYADIACLLTLKAGPDIYQSAFMMSKEFKDKDHYVDIEKEIRCSVVANSVKCSFNDPADAKLKADWECYADQLSQGQRKNLTSNLVVSERQTTGVEILINGTVLECYEKYGELCAKVFSDLIDNFKDDLAKIRKSFALIMSDKKTVLNNLVSGVEFASSRDDVAKSEKADNAMPEKVTNDDTS